MLNFHTQSILHGVGSRLVTDASVEPVGPLFKGPVVQKQPEIS